MDLHSKKILGYAYDISMTAELAIKAVKNACIESFHSILKKEEVNQNEYDDFKSAKRALFEYIESWYNRKRIHRAINYLTPQPAHSAA